MLRPWKGDNKGKNKFIKQEETEQKVQRNTRKNGYITSVSYNRNRLLQKDNLHKIIVYKIPDSILPKF